MGTLQCLLDKAWRDAADSKDQVQDRTSMISYLLSLLTASYQQPWFQDFLVEHVAETYPKPFRCLLDAVLQAFLALSPLHCGPVLQAFLVAIPGCINLNAPFRRDIAALFKPPSQLSSCWQQQSEVVCSIIACLATDASQSLWELLTGQQLQLELKQRGQQQLGTAVGWLVDCLLHAVPNHVLLLMQLALAVAIATATKLERPQFPAAEEVGNTDSPPAKKPRLEQHQLHATFRTTSNSPSLAALELGVQLLTMICCCEIVQHNSRQLVPYAAAAAASAAVGDMQHAVHAVHAANWVCRQLCSQVTAPPAPSGSTAPVHGTAGSAVTGSEAAKQERVPAGLQPSMALATVLQQLAGFSPMLVLHFVNGVLGMPLSVASGESTPAGGGPMQHSTLVTSGAVASCIRNGTSDGATSGFLQCLTDAAKQWRPLPSTTTRSSKKQKGKKGGKHTGQQQDHGTPAAAPQPSLLLLKQVMPDAPPLKAVWVCKHIVPILVRQAQAQHTAQQCQLRRDVQLPAVAALVALLSAEGLLLPAAGEVLVSSRIVAEALNSVGSDLQSMIAAEWSRQLKEQATAGASKQHERKQPLLRWQVLQPMLCLLSTLELTSPLATFLGACVSSCIRADAASEVQMSYVTRDILQHVLLPVRFGIKMSARVWLLQHLLQQTQLQEASATAQHSGACGISDASQPETPNFRMASVVLHTLNRMLSGDWQRQLAQGLQLLAKQQGLQQVSTATGNSSALSLQQAQGMDLAASLLQLYDLLKGKEARAVTGDVLMETDGANALAVQQVAQQIGRLLLNADAATFAALTSAACSSLDRQQ